MGGIIQLAHTLIETRCHVCAFFQRSNEEYKILVPLLQEGVDMRTRRSTSSIPLAVPSMFAG